MLMIRARAIAVPVRTEWRNAPRKANIRRRGLEVDGNMTDGGKTILFCLHYITLATRFSQEVLLWREVTRAHYITAGTTPLAHARTCTIINLWQMLKHRSKEGVFEPSKRKNLVKIKNEESYLTAANNNSRS